MQINPLAKGKFKDWENVANFSSNGDTWTAPSDGFILVLASDNLTTSEYAYIRDVAMGNMNICCIACLNGTQGLTFSNMAPIQKGKQYVIRTSFSSITVKFMAYDN